MVFGYMTTRRHHGSALPYGSGLLAVTRTHGAGEPVVVGWGSSPTSLLLCLVG